MSQTAQFICEGVKWIDVTNPSASEVEELSITYQLNKHLVQDCMQPEHLPKYEFVDNVHFMILRFYESSENGTATTIQELTNKVAIFYTDQYLLTIHKTSADFIEIIRNRYLNNARCVSTTEVVAKIVWNALESFESRVDVLSSQVENRENEIIKRKTTADQMEALYLIKREASLCYKLLVLMQEPANHIIPNPGEEAMIQDVKDQHFKMQTLYSQILDDVNNLMNLFMSFSAQKTNEVVKVLTIFSVFFMPLTFIVGIYGMNFEFMPELQTRWGYPAVLLLMAAVTVFIYIWFKKKKWL